MKQTRQCLCGPHEKPAWRRPVHRFSVDEHGKKQAVHRIVWEKHNGPIPHGMHIHHVNGIHDDNRIENLAMLTPSEHHKLHAANRLRWCCQCWKWKERGHKHEPLRSEVMR